MKKTMTVKEAAILWDISDRRIVALCKQGRIENAIKEGNEWRIPIGTPKPKDRRRPENRKSEQVSFLPLPVGVSDYKETVNRYYYVDKTLLIKDFLDEIPKVSLFTRPRRFGKTLNMDMLRVFFEKTEEDTSVYFKDKLIWSQGEKYQKHQGKYPVIFLSFKDVKHDNWEETFQDLSSLLSKEFLRHKNLMDSAQCNELDKKYYLEIIHQTLTEVDTMRALETLTKMLHEHYGIAPLLIIDEYDTPIQQGYLKGFYDEVVLFMRNLFSGGLKDNSHLSYGFLTGILRVAKESIVSGLNNLVINSVLDHKYSQYFGFTAEEVRAMTEYYQIENKYDEICDWYDGYRFGHSNIFNPWSVINYFRNECRPEPYWQATGNNDILVEILSNVDVDVMKHLESLLQRKSFVTKIDTDVIYPQIKSDPSSIYSFLLVAGYLKIVSSNMQLGGYTLCEVALPNKEISSIYSKEILGKFENIIPRSSAFEIQEAIYRHQTDELQKGLSKLLLRSISFHDGANEIFYHGLILGLCAMLDNQYRVTSNRESGKGRYDIQLCPYNKQMPGILIELKAGKDCDEKQLQKLAETALNQIEMQRYEAELVSAGIEKILKYGVAFCGKKVKIASN